jgi:hypothetical protein
MRESAFETKGRWVLASGGAVAVTVILLLLFRFPAPTTPLISKLVSPVPATIKLARPDNTDLVLKEEAELRDLRPLFLPTERNAALPEPRLEPGRTFLENETIKLMFTAAEAQVSKGLPPVATLDGQRVEEATPVNALSPHENGMTVQGFGRTNAAIVPFVPRAGYLEVTGIKDGVRVLGQELPPEARSPTQKSWSPVEFIAVVDAAGLVSPLVVTDGSRVDEVDSHFRIYLAQNFRIGEQLPPGFYRITVAP